VSARRVAVTARCVIFGAVVSATGAPTGPSGVPGTGARAGVTAGGGTVPAGGGVSGGEGVRVGGGGIPGCWTRTSVLMH
jgi:hypothetical protein